MALDLGIPAVIAAVVATVCTLLAAAAWRALVRTGNRGIWFVVSAFGVMALKNFAKALSLSSGTREGAELELIFTMLDLATAALFAWPIFRRAGRHE